MADEDNKAQEQKSDDKQGSQGFDYALDSKGQKVGIGDTVIIACRVAGVHGDRLSVVSNLGFEDAGLHHETFYIHAGVTEMTVSTDAPAPGNPSTDNGDA